VVHHCSVHHCSACVCSTKRGSETIELSVSPTKHATSIFGLLDCAPHERADAIAMHHMHSALSTATAEAHTVAETFGREVPSDCDTDRQLQAAAQLTHALTSVREYLNLRHKTLVSSKVEDHIGGQAAAIAYLERKKARLRFRVKAAREVGLIDVVVDLLLSASSKQAREATPYPLAFDTLDCMLTRSQNAKHFMQFVPRLTRCALMEAHSSAIGFKKRMRETLKDLFRSDGSNATKIQLPRGLIEQLVTDALADSQVIMIHILSTLCMNHLLVAQTVVTSLAVRSPCTFVGEEDLAQLRRTSCMPPPALEIANALLELIGSVARRSLSESQWRALDEITPLDSMLKLATDLRGEFGQATCSCACRVLMRLHVVARAGTHSLGEVGFAYMWEDCSPALSTSDSDELAAKLDTAKDCILSVLNWIASRGLNAEAIWGSEGSEHGESEADVDGVTLSLHHDRLVKLFDLLHSLIE
jgi:hypothetical protein